jgi:hypothetical protein
MKNRLQRREQAARVCYGAVCKIKKEIPNLVHTIKERFDHESWTIGTTHVASTEVPGDHTS